MDEKLMYISNEDNLGYNFSRSKLLIKKFGHCLFELTNRNPMKVPKVFEPKNRKIHIFLSFAYFYILLKHKNRGQYQLSKPPPSYTVYELPRVGFF